MKEVSQRTLSALIAATDDSSEDVRTHVVQAFRQLGGRDTDGVLTHAVEWLLGNGKPNGTSAQRLWVFRCIAEVIRAHASTPGILSATLMRDLLRAARFDMIGTNEHTSELAKEACSLFVIVWDLSPPEGTKVLLFNDGASTEKAAVGAAAVPHFFTLKCLTDCCNASPLRMVPFIRDALHLLVPMLASVKQDNPRMSLAMTLASLAEAVLHLERYKLSVASRGRTAVSTSREPSAAHVDPNGGEDEEPAEEEGDDLEVEVVAALTPRSSGSSNCSRATFTESFMSACQHLLQEWSRVSELRVRGPVAHAIGAMSGALEEQSRAAMFPKVVNMVVAAVKKEKPRDMLAPAQAAAAMCDVPQDAVAAVILSHADAMLQCVAQSLTLVAADRDFDGEPPSGPLHATQRHLLRWAENIATCGVQAIVSFAAKSFDPKTGSKEGPYRAAVVNIIRHVCSRRSLAARLTPHRDYIIATLKLVTVDPDWHVRRAVAAAVTAMATNSSVSFMTQVGARDLFTFIVKGTSISDQVIADIASKMNGNKMNGVNPAEELRDSCRASLGVMCTSQKHLDEAILWPGILEHMSQYEKEPDLLNSFMSTVVRCIPPVAERTGPTGTYFVDFNRNVNLPRPTALVSILCAHAISAFPAAGMTPGRSSAAVSAVKNVLAAMEALGPLLDEPYFYMDKLPQGAESPRVVADLWLASVPEIRDLICPPPPEEGVEAAPPPLSFVALSDWEDLIIRIVTRTVSARAENEWVDGIATSALALMGVCTSGGREDLFRGFAVVCGAALAKCQRPELVAASIDTAIDLADPDRPVHRAAIARLVSSVAVNKAHVDTVLEKVAVICKPPPEKKSGFFSFGSKDKEQAASRRKLSERSRAMAALALCQVSRKLCPAKATNVEFLASRLDASIAPLLQQALSDAPDAEVRTAVLEAMQLLDQPLKKLSATPSYIFKARDGLLDVALTIAANSADAANANLSAAPGKGRPDAASLVPAFNAAMATATTLITCVAAPRATVAQVERVATIMTKNIIPCRAIAPVVEEVDAATDDAAASPKVTASAPSVTESFPEAARKSLPLASVLYAAILKSAAPTKLDIDAAIAPFLPSTAAVEESSRQRAMCLSLAVLRDACSGAENAVNDSEVAAEGRTALDGLSIEAGTLLSTFIPRLVDPHPECRKHAVDCVTAVITLHGMSKASADVEGGASAAASGTPELRELCDVSIDELECIRDRIVAVDLSPLANRLLVDKELAAISKVICSVVVRVLPTPKLFLPLLDHILGTTLKDPFTDGVAAACVTLHGCIRGMGGLISEQQAQQYLVRVVAAAAQVLDRESTLSTLLVAVRNLAKHHGEASFNALVKRHEPPHAPHVIKAMQAVAGDSSLNTAFVNYCVDTILNSPVLRDDSPPQGTRVGSLNAGPISAACALGWCGAVSKCEPVLQEMRATLICVLALYTANLHELGQQKCGDAAIYAGEAAHLLVRAVSSDVTADRLERFGWIAFVTPGPAYISVVTETIKYWSQEDLYGEELTTDGDRTLPAPPPGDEFIVGLPLEPSEPTQTIVEVAEFMLPYAEKPTVAHRRVAIGVAGAVLMRHSISDDALLSSVVTALLGRTGPDEDPNLRFVALRSFGQLLCHEYASAAPFVSPACTALLSNFDDPNRDICLAAMDIFARFLRELTDKTHIQAMVVNASLKLKVKYEHPDPMLRAAAFSLLAAVLELAVDGAIDGAHPEQQAYTHFVALIAHTQDDSPEARSGAKSALSAALRLIALRSKNAVIRTIVADLVDKPHLDPSLRSSSSAAMEELLSDLARLWVTQFPGRVNDLMTAAVGFFEAPQQPLRLAATALAGALLKQLPAEELPRTNAEVVLSGLMRLTRSSSERSEEVRARAIRALGGLPAL